MEEETVVEDSVEASEAIRPRIAVARDEAFCFYYEENLRLLEQAGAEPVYFSPLHDRNLPENIHGLLLGGGYPELYAKALSENKKMLTSVREAVQRSGRQSQTACPRWQSAAVFYTCIRP